MKNTSDFRSTFKIKSHGLVALMVSGMLSATVSFAAPATTALPTGGSVSNGQAVIATTGNTMNINQASNKSIIGWNSFNIGSASTVNYNFANKGSSSLNRVNDNNPSQIFGKLNANGQVILVNPNGIVFGAGSSVNVGSLVATTMNIKDADYLDGKMVFTRDGAIGKILNEGSITAEDAGYIALLAPEVVNAGAIKASMGTISLAAGDKIELTLDSSGLKTVIVEPSTIQGLIDNRGLVSAEGGNIYLGAKQAQALVDSVMNITNSGTLEASSMTRVGGKIILDSGIVVNNGTINASGTAGGSVQVTANLIIDAGVTKADGTTGNGGTITQNADEIMQSKFATLSANSQNAHGGSISIVSNVLDLNTQAYLSGSMSATGKDGGTITATSHKVTLAGATIDTSGTDNAGNIKMGGGWQGKDTSIANASKTFIDSSSKLTNSIWRQYPS
jgi:filamentous hemagglutinin family protein